MSVIIGTSDFKILPTNAKAKIRNVNESLLQDSEKNIIWYRDNFFGKMHSNFLTVSSTRGPMAISLIKDGDVYKALVRSTTGSERLSVSANSISTSFIRKILGMGPSNFSIMTAISRNIPANEVFLNMNPDLPSELLAMEERQVIRSYKFGVAYCKDGQCTEEEMFANTHESSSEDFKSFLNFLGETISLKGWKGYRAGLDVTETGNTGKNSVYTKWQGYEIMFHVATHLPYKATDKQQLERKRHIGNDIVNIVFQDNDSIPFKIETLSSHQTHVIIFVSPHADGYRVTATSKTGVPSFTPELPEPCIIAKDAVSRDFFIHKLINGERASYKAPSFAPKISRTRQILLTDVASKFSS